MKDFLEAVEQSRTKAATMREAFIATMTAKHNADKAKFLVNVAERMLKMTSIGHLVRDPIAKHLVKDFLSDLCTDLTVLEAEKIGVVDVAEINALGEDARTFAQELLDAAAEGFSQFREQEGVVLH